MSTTSLGTSPFTPVAALKAADRILGQDRLWRPVTEEQKVWLADTFTPCERQLTQIPEIDAHASTSLNDHNAFMRKHGREPQVTQIPHPGFATAAVLDVSVEWPRVGKRTKLSVPDQGQFPAVLFEAGLSSARHREGKREIFTLATKSDDKVLIAEAPREPTDADDLLRMAKGIFEAPTEKTYTPGLIVPMVDLACKQSLDWLIGLHTISDRREPSRVEQALQQATFKLNEKGALARAADEMTMRNGVPRHVRIEKPFLISIKRMDLSRPLFVAYVSFDAWKDPGRELDAK